MTIPRRQATRGLRTIRNIEEQVVRNAPKVQPQGEVTNAKFREAIRMQSKDVNNQVGQQRRSSQEED